MILDSEIDQALQRNAGLQSASPVTETLRAPAQVEVDIQWLAVDSMSCAVWEIVLRIPRLAGADLQTLEAWSNEFCGRVTYLLEDIGALEHDSNKPAVLIRSNRPTASSSGPSEYYEVLLQSQGGHSFALRRFCFQHGTAGRNQVPLTITHEVLKKLVHDVIDSVPA